MHGDYIKRLLAQYPTLTPREVKLSAYLWLNLNTKEIAQLMNISTRGVEISRYRLRKKLNLERNENLTGFVLKFRGDPAPPPFLSPGGQILSHSEHFDRAAKGPVSR